MVRCTSSVFGLLCTLNLLLVGLGLTSICVVCWLEDGSTKNASAVLIAIPCFTILSGFFGCISQCQEGCLRIHIATVMASMVLLVGGFCVMTVWKDEVVSQIVESGVFPSVASGVVSWSQIFFILMICGQAVVLLSACVVRCWKVFIQKRDKARDREFARHLRRIIGGCPCPPNRRLPGSGQGTTGTVPASEKPHLHIPQYDNENAAGNSGGEQINCGPSAEESDNLVAAPVYVRPVRPWRPFARAQTQVPFFHPSHVRPLSMGSIMEELQHAITGENANESETRSANEEDVDLCEYEDAENPDAGADSELSSSSSPSPSLHSAKSELITDIHEATMKMRSRMPDPDFFGPRVSRKVSEITESEQSSDSS